MHQLNPEQENDIQDFIYELAMIDGPDDMFPPDDIAGVREPRRPFPSSGPTHAEVALASIHNLAAIRERRKNIAYQTAKLMRRMDEVLA